MDVIRTRVDVILSTFTGEDQIDIVANRVEQVIKGRKHKLVKSFVSHLISKGSKTEPELQPLFAKLVLQLTRRRCFSHADVSESVEVQTNSEPEEFSPAFIGRLKFIKELAKLEMILAVPQVFLHYANYFAKTGESDYFVPFLYEILRNYDELLLEAPAARQQEGRSPAGLNKFVCYLDTIFKISGPISNPKLLEIADYVRIKHNWHPPSVGCENIFANLRDPRPLTRTGPYRTTEELLQVLQNNPEGNVESIIFEIRKNLHSKVTRRKQAKNILQTASQNNPMPPAMFRLIKTLLKDIGTFQTGAKHWVRLTFKPENCWHKKIWFLNDLYRAGFRRVRGFMNHLLSSNKRQVRTLSFVHLLYELLVNFDELFNSGDCSFNEATKDSYRKCAEFLSNRLKQDVALRSCHKAPEMTQFLQSLKDQNDSWFQKQNATEAGSSFLSQPSLFEPSTSGPVQHEPVLPPQIVIVLDSPSNLSNDDNTNLTELTTDRVKELLGDLGNHPEKVNEIGSEMKTGLSNCPAKPAFTALVSALLDELLKQFHDAKALSPVSRQLLKSLNKVSLQIGNDPVFRFSMAVHDWAVRKFQCQPNFEVVSQITEQLWYHSELCKLGLLPLRLYKAHISRAFLMKTGPAPLFYMFQILQEVDSLLEVSSKNKCLVYGEDEAAFFSSTSVFLTMTCNRRDLADFDKTTLILQSLQAISRKGGWFRTISRTIPENIGAHPVETPVPRQEVIEDSNHTNYEPGSFNLKGNIDNAIENLKQYLKLQPPAIFTERVGDILEKMFSQLASDALMEPATKLCIGISKVTSNCDKSFMIELQEHCLKWFNKAYRIGVERMLSDLHQEVESAHSPQEKAILAENLQSAMGSFHRKTTECPKLIGRLFSAECLPVCFVVSFIDTLIQTRNEEIYPKIFEMLAEIGKQIEMHATSRDLGDVFNKCFQDLSRIRDEPDSSSFLKENVEEIIFLRQNNWIALTPEQRALKKLKAMLEEAEESGDPQVVFNRIRAYLDKCPLEMFRSFNDILISKLQEMTLCRCHDETPCIKEERTECSHGSAPIRKRPCDSGPNDAPGTSKRRFN